jgi:hypothetical protein
MIRERDRARFEMDRLKSVSRCVHDASKAVVLMISNARRATRTSWSAPVEIYVSQKSEPKMLLVRRAPRCLVCSTSTTGSSMSSKILCARSRRRLMRS